MLNRSALEDDPIVDARTRLRLAEAFLQLHGGQRPRPSMVFSASDLIRSGDAVDAATTYFRPCSMAAGPAFVADLLLASFSVNKP